MASTKPAESVPSVDPRPRVLPGRPARRWSARFRLLSGMCAWSYLALVIGMLCLLRFTGDRWWPATLLTFGPRWVVLAPLPLLLPPVALCRFRHLLPLAAAAILAVGPIMGYCIPWRAFVRGRPDEARLLRVMTYNAGEGGNDPQALEEFLARYRPDVIVLNEWGLAPVPPCLSKDWHVIGKGIVMLASRFPIVGSEVLSSPRLERWHAPAARFDLETGWGAIHVVAVHLETPREGIEELMGSRGRDSAGMERTTEIRRVESELTRDLAVAAPGPTIVAGDFNMPIDSVIYRRDWSDWQNAFSSAGLGFGYTKFTRRIAIRIDHILADDAWRIIEASVGPGFGGDHRPVVSTLELR